MYDLGRTYVGLMLIRMSRNYRHHSHKHRRDTSFTFTPNEARILHPTRNHFRGGQKVGDTVAAVCTNNIQFSQLVVFRHVQLLRW